MFFMLARLGSPAGIVHPPADELNVTSDVAEPKAVRGACYTSSTSMSEPLRYRFASFELDLGSRELRKNGMRIKLQDQPLTVLELLIARKGELVTREEIRKRLWPADTFVDFDRSLNTAINRLRDALGDEAENPRFIETLPRRGYRFVFPAEVLGEAPAPSPPPGVVEPPKTEVSKRLWLWRIGAMLFITAALTLYFTGWRVNRDPVPAGAKTIVAVLPFPNRTGDAAQDYFSEGLTQKLIARLGHTTVSVYQQSGKDLGAQYVIEGIVKGGDGRVQIDARLTRIAGGVLLWSKSYEGDVRDIQRVQVNVAEDLVEAITSRAKP
jgi:DNA-binding winged helix-turn-helix (wHTH) protein/TolB-like protein